MPHNEHYIFNNGMFFFLMPSWFSTYAVLLAHLKAASNSSNCDEWLDQTRSLFRAELKESGCLYISQEGILSVAYLVLSIA